MKLFVIDHIVRLNHLVFYFFILSGSLPENFTEMVIAFYFIF